MTQRGTLQIFLLQGLTIGLGGTALGVGGGVALSYNLQVVVGLIEKAFSFKVFSPEVYYISEIPSQLLWGDVVIAAVASILLSVIAAVYPARKALQVMRPRCCAMSDSCCVALGWPSRSARVRCR